VVFFHCVDEELFFVGESGALRSGSVKVLAAFFAPDDRGDFLGDATVFDGFFEKVLVGPLNEFPPDFKNPFMGEAPVAGIVSGDGFGVGNFLNELFLGISARSAPSPLFS
jgi:hypothetical protein